MANKDKKAANDDDPKGTILIKLADVPVQTAELEIAGFKWELCWKKETNRCLISCNQNCGDRLWLCWAKYIFQTKDSGKWVEWPDNQEPVYWHNSYRTEAIELTYSDDNSRMKATALKVDMKTTALKVDIQILWAAHESCFPLLDAILDVKYGKDSKQFHVNRHTLASHSPTYFGDLFFGDLAKKRKKQTTADGGKQAFVIEEKADLNSSAFGRMLYSVHFSLPLVEKKAFMDNAVCQGVLDLLELAIKYKFPMLIHHGEQCLIKLGPGTMKQLVVAEAQNLPALKKHCLDTMDVLEYSENFLENNDLLARLGKESRQLLDKRFKETAKRYGRKRKMLEEDSGDEMKSGDDKEEEKTDEDGSDAVEDESEEDDEAGTSEDEQ